MWKDTRPTVPSFRVFHGESFRMSTRPLFEILEAWYIAFERFLELCTITLEQKLLRKFIELG